MTLLTVTPPVGKIGPWSLLGAGCCAVWLWAAASNARAEPRRYPDITLNEAARLVRESGRYRVLGGRTVELEGSPVHEFRVVTPGGRVQLIRVRPTTGQILKE